MTQKIKSKTEQLKEKLYDYEVVMNDYIKKWYYEEQMVHVICTKVISNLFTTFMHLGFKNETKRKDGNYRLITQTQLNMELDNLQEKINWFKEHLPTDMKEYFAIPDQKEWKKKQVEKLTKLL